MQPAVNEKQSEPRFTTDWMSRFTGTWREVLAPLIGRQHTALEVGCFEGRSACWFLDNVLTHPQSRLICVDPFEIPACDRGDPALIEMYAGLEERFVRNIDALGHTHKVLLRKGESSRVLPTLERGSLSFAYVDGSHLAWDVLTDAVLCWPLVRSGGILLFDDYPYDRTPANGPPLKPAVGIDAFLSTFEGQYTVLVKGWQVIIQKT